MPGDGFPKMHTRSSRRRKTGAPPTTSTSSTTPLNSMHTSRAERWYVPIHPLGYAGLRSLIYNL